jgi:serine/threonine-protein kinase
MSAGFVVHPDGTVDYPDTGCHTMSAEEFAAADTQQAWSQAEPPPEPQPYYEPHHYEPTYHEPPYHEPPHHDWIRVLKLVSGVAACALVIAAVIVLVTSLTKPVTPTNPSSYPTATVTDTPPPGSTVIIPPPPPGPTVIIPAPRPTPDPNVTASNQLSALASDDAGFVSEVLAGRWVAQLSSKKPGTIDDGIQYDDQAILNEHLELRRDYNAKILTKSGYWVTVAPLVFLDQESANDWCRAVGRDTDHCFAAQLNINE